MGWVCLYKKIPANVLMFPENIEPDVMYVVCFYYLRTYERNNYNYDKAGMERERVHQ